jgi:hypothetical protein
MNSAVAEIDIATQNNAVSTEQAAASASLLLKEADHVMEIVDVMYVITHGKEYDFTPAKVSGAERSRKNAKRSNGNVNGKNQAYLEQ